MFAEAIVLKMIQSLRFKTTLGFNFVAHYSNSKNSESDTQEFVFAGTQMLRIPEIAIKVMQNNELRELVYKQFEKLWNVDRSIGDSQKVKLFWFISDCEYKLKGPTIEYLLQNDGLERFLNTYAKYSMNDSIKMRSTHILTEEEGYFYNGLDYAFFSLQIGYSLIKEIDYTDLKFNQKVASLFSEAIETLEPKFSEHLTDGYFNVPVVKCFAMYISRYLMTNLSLMDPTIMDSNVSTDHSLKKTIHNLLEKLFSQHDDEDVEKIINLSAKLAARVLGFNDEIRSNKWINYGVNISVLPNILSRNLGHFFNDPCFVMTQLAFLLSQDPSKLLEQVISSYSIDGSMTKIFYGVLNSPESYAHSPNDEKKDEANLRQMLYLFITLLSNDREILYFWNSQKEFLHYEYDSKVDESRQKIFNKASKYEAVHALVKE